MAQNEGAAKYAVDCFENDLSRLESMTNYLGANSHNIEILKNKLLGYLAALDNAAIITGEETMRYWERIHYFKPVV